MSFDSRDLTIDVLPVSFGRPGLQMCGQATAGDGLDEDEEEEEDLECGQATAGPGGDTGYVPAEGLALLRQQLQERLASREGA